MAAGAALGGLALGTGTDTLAWISLTIFAAALVTAALSRKHAFPPDPTATGNTIHDTAATQRSRP